MDESGFDPQPDGRGTTTLSAKERRAAFALLFICLMTSGAGNSILFAVLPPIARDLSLPDFAVGVIYTVSAVFLTVSAQLWGRLSDRFGRKPIILIGLMGYALSTISFAIVIENAQFLAASIGVIGVVACLALARGLFGLIGSAAGPAAQAYVADRTRPIERTEAIAALTAAYGFGAALGPGIAGWVAPRLGLVAPLYFIAVFGLACAVAVRFRLPERTPPKSERRDAARPKLSLAFDVRLRGILSAAVLTWVVQGVALQTTNFLVMDRVGVTGRSATELGGAVLTASALAILTSQLGIIRTLKPPPRTAMTWGACLSCAGALMMAFSHAFGEILFAAVLAGLGMGLTRPAVSAAASLAVERHEQGAAAGLAMSMAGIGFLIAPFAGLLLYQEVGRSAPFLLSAALAIWILGVALFDASVRRASTRAV